MPPAPSRAGRGGAGAQPAADGRRDRRVGLLVLALAQPERVGAPVEITRAARDVVLAIDISGSMDARDFRPMDSASSDWQPSATWCAFVEGRQGDRMALIVFGAKAYVQAPLTEDLGTIVDLLERTEVGMAGPHTALGDAIGLAIRTFETSNIEQRLLILLSDGTDTASRMSPVNAAEIAGEERSRSSPSVSATRSQRRGPGRSRDVPGHSRAHRGRVLLRRRPGGPRRSMSASTSWPPARSRRSPTARASRSPGSRWRRRAGRHAEPSALLAIGARRKAAA